MTQVDRCVFRMTGGQVSSQTNCTGTLVSWNSVSFSFNKQKTGLEFYLIMELKFQKVILKIITAYILKKCWAWQGQWWEGEDKGQTWWEGVPAFQHPILL